MDLIYRRQAHTRSALAIRPHDPEAGLQSEPPECYLMIVARLVTLLIIFAFVFANGPAIAMAKCQHEDALAHAAALQSSESNTSAVAQSEETAAKAVAKKGSLSEAATTLLAGYIAPTDSSSFPRRFVESAHRLVTNATGLGSRSVPPLLEPPLA